MSRLLRGVVTACLIGLGVAALALGLLYALTQGRYSATYDVQPAMLPVSPEGDLSPHAEGLAQLMCAGCHGQDMGGQMMGDSLLYGRAPASNLTAGAGGVAAAYSGEDWARAILHGVGPDGRALVGMPSHLYGDFDEETLGMLVAYFEGLPPVDSDLPATTVGPLARLNLLLGLDPHLSAEQINHEAPRQTDFPEEMPDAEE